MMRLIRLGLIYGNLTEVASPVLIARYNAALNKLIGKSTALTEFSIDISGFSPEIAEELQDEHYLNPHGVNRMFILLTPEQAKAPLINAKFSTSRDILKAFIADNEDQLFTLTAKDAVCGELNNSVYRLNEPKDLFRIREIEVEADTPAGLITTSQTLERKIETFKTKEDAWWDDVLVAELIKEAKTTGNILRHPLKFTRTAYEQGNFFTTHFGGLYVFRDLKRATVIALDPPKGEYTIPVDQVFTPSDRAGITEFLLANKLVEPLGREGDAILQQRMDFMVIDALAGSGSLGETVSRRDIRAGIHRHIADLPDEFHALTELLQRDASKRRLPLGHPAWFYTQRATKGPNRDLVNMLLTEFTPRDPRQLFIWNKPAFYRAYAKWPEAKQAYIAQKLSDEYMLDKKGVRAELYGAEDSMAEPEVQSGPWGSFKARGS